MLVIVVAGRPEAAKSRNGRDASAVSFQNAADLADSAGIVIEMLERLTGGDAVERTAAKRHPRQIAEDDRNARSAANVQDCIKSGVDPEDSKARLLQPLRKLAEAHGRVKNARLKRQLLRLGKDD